MSFRVFNLTLLLFKYKLSQSCKQWQSRQLPRLGEAFGTSLLPQSHLSPASKSAAWGRTIYKTPKLSFKVEEPKLRQSLHSVLHSPQCRSHSASDFGFGDTSQLCTRASPLVAQHSSSGTKSSQRWHGRHGVAAGAAGHSRGHFFLGGAQTTRKPWSNTERKPRLEECPREAGPGQTRPRGLRSGRSGRGGGCCSSAERMRCSCESRARSDVQDNRLSW